MTTPESQTPAPLELRSFIDRVPALAWSALPDGSLDFCNQRFRDYTGLSPDQLYGSEWKSAVHRDDIQKLETWWQDLKQSQEPGKTEVRLRRFDGEYHWFQIAASPVHDEQAELVRWCGINTEIDDIKCSERKLRQEEAYFRTITDTIRQIIVVLAPDGTTLYANRAVLDLTGLTLDEAKEQGFFQRAFHPDDVDHFRVGRQQALLRGDPFELEMRGRLKNGQYRWYLNQYNPLKDERGQIIRWYATATDIDDQKMTEERLRNENVRLAQERVYLEEQIRSEMGYEQIFSAAPPNIAGAKAAAAAARKFRRFIITSSLSLASLETKQLHHTSIERLYIRALITHGKITDVRCSVLLQRRKLFSDSTDSARQYREL